MTRPPHRLLALTLPLLPFAAQGADAFEDVVYSTSFAGDAQDPLPALVTEIPADVPPERPYSQQEMFEGFWRHLSPYGRWVQDSRLGWLWFPNEGREFRPYSDGRWVRSVAGWAFLSDAPYAWAVYHYGRWAFESGNGWAWVPGYEWAPAWVTFRMNDQYVGWAPLGPDGAYDFYVPGVLVQGARYSPWVFVNLSAFDRPSCAASSIGTGVAVIAHRDARSVPFRGGPHSGGPVFDFSLAGLPHGSEPVSILHTSSLSTTTSASGFSGSALVFYRVDLAPGQGGTGSDSFAQPFGTTAPGAPTGPGATSSASAPFAPVVLPPPFHPATPAFGFQPARGPSQGTWRRTHPPPASPHSAGNPGPAAPALFPPLKPNGSHAAVPTSRNRSGPHSSEPAAKAGSAGTDGLWRGWKR
jgi:hypothetical protein